MFQNISSIRTALQQGHFVSSVEINPPVGSFDLTHLINTTQKLYEAGINTINIADGPRALLRMSNSAMGQIIKQTTSVNPMLHVCCRDKSFLGLQSHLLGLHVLGFRDLCIVSGDPPNLGNYPNSSGVYDLNSIELLRLIKNYNLGIDPIGQTMPNTDFYCGTGVEPAAENYEQELSRLKMKQDAGADFVMLGSLLAGTDEAPGEVVDSMLHGMKMKSYRGMASREAQEEWRGKSSAPEGIATMVPYKGPLENIFNDLVGNIKSGLSYSGATNIGGLFARAEFIRQTSAGQSESSTHILSRTPHGQLR